MSDDKVYDVVEGLVMAATFGFVVFAIAMLVTGNHSASIASALIALVGIEMTR